jgi:hypothetical protein
MLDLEPPHRGVDAAVQRYLYEALGVVAELKPWAGLRKLPYYLHEAFEFREVSLFNDRLLLAIDRLATKAALANVRAQLDNVRAIAGLPVVYVTRALASYERRHLIQQHLPFIVPGNQLYLPDVGVDLREYFRRRRTPPESALSPATQAVLITVLLQKPWQAEWRPAPVVAALGYTPMTLSRVAGEIVAAGVATMEQRGKERWLRMERPASDAWEHIKPLLRSPVKRCVWAPAAPRVKPAARLAGLSALAQLSMLAEPHWSTYALGPSQWREVREAGVETLPDPVPGAREWQLWRYSPALVPNDETVDPLSLTLSLLNDSDERVQLALQELEGKLPW